MAISTVQLLHYIVQQVSVEIMREPFKDNTRLASEEQWLTNNNSLVGYPPAKQHIVTRYKRACGRA